VWACGVRAGGAHRGTGQDDAPAARVPDADRAWRRRYGDLVELLVLGDGLAAGLGARKPRQTLGGRLARSLADRVERTVWLTTAARPGASGRDLGTQLDRLPPSCGPDVAVVVVGAEDASRGRRLAGSPDALAATLGRLRAEGCEVVVGSCPGSASGPGADGARWLARAQERVALAGGARVVSLTDLDGVPTGGPAGLGAEPRVTRPWPGRCCRPCTPRCAPTTPRCGRGR
jgi:hypothetical protein